MSDSTGLPAFLTSLWHQEEIIISCFASCGLRAAVMLLWEDVRMKAELAPEQGRGDSIVETFCLEIREG